MIRGALGAAGALGGATVAGTTHGPDLVGIAAILTAVGGLLTLAWTVYQGTRRKQGIDADAAAAIIEAVLKEREGHHDAPE